MKLVFYDEMPKSPAFAPNAAHRVSHWVAHGRDLASRASDRASLTIKKKLSKQNISGPVAFIHFDDLPPRRVQFRPLELSIYLPGNRLSDLPEFQDLDFTSTGEIQVPPKALIRARSEDLLQSCSQPQTRPTMSMVGERQLDYWQHRPTYSTSQRPPSACEALNSHPVYWHSLPGLPPQDAAINTLSPMVEEEEPITTPRTTDIVLEFPPIQEQEQESASCPPIASVTPPLSIQVPYKKPLRAEHPRLNSFGRTRLSHWLSLSSYSTRTASLDDHHPQFYQCAVSPPLHQHSPSQTRQRSFSVSTFASSIGSPAESLASMTTMTTAPTVHSARSRSGTLRSVGKHVTVVEEESLPEIPHVYAQARDVNIGKALLAAPSRAVEVI